MRKSILVLRNEFITTVTRKSFLFTAFGLPLIGFLIFFAAGALGRSGAGAGEAAGGMGAFTLRPEGIVDEAHIVRTIPADTPPGALTLFPDEASARQALETGQIRAYYRIPADYLETGRLYLIDPDARPLTSGGQTWIMRWALLVNLLGGDAQRAARVRNPMEVNTTALSPTPLAETESDAAFWIPYTVTLIFYFVIIMSASLLLNSVSKEKQNRVIEILMASVSPREMLVGKIAGLGLAGLLQTLVWVLTGYTLLRIGGETLRIPVALQPTPALVVWAVVFFLLGYALYASLMAALGALVPNLREASQATISVIWPLLLPLFFISALVQEPDGALALAMGFFPFTAPVAMMTRLSAASVPVWQPVLAAALLAATVVFVVRAVSRMFRAQTLLSGQAFSAKRFWGALLGRE
ncbi:MAG: ABC transporter permease [Chloroflexi bacterium]|nr:ABC transporter permease [Chloroflexota bacterium]